MKDGNVFLDTNIIIYSIDSENISKQNISEDIIKSLIVSGNGFISHQVVQEFLHTSQRKFKDTLSKEQVLQFSNSILFPLLRIFPSKKFFLNALDIQERWRYSFYDSLIISAALSVNCNTLYSEDLQHDQKIFELTIRNPFLS